MIVFHILAVMVGIVVVAVVLSAAVRTVVVPRGEHVLLTKAVFGMTRRVLRVVREGSAHLRTTAIV